MTNINKIKIVIIDLSDDGYLPSLDLFDFHLFFNNTMFVGVFINNPSTIFELSMSGYHTVYDIESFSLLDLTVKDSVLNYIGVNLTTDEILDIMLNEKLTINRKFYLETILYYKNNQRGKDLKEYKLTVKHFDDLINCFPEDFVSYNILQNNEDFSVSDICINTYLTNDEMNQKFGEFIIK
jgi:hypothetical protein